LILLFIVLYYFIKEYKMTSKTDFSYHFGVSNEIIWSSHILMGLFFIYVGYEIIIKQKLSVPVALIVVVLGALATLYHTHIWYENLKRKKKTL